MMRVYKIVVLATMVVIAARSASSTDAMPGIWLELSSTSGTPGEQVTLEVTLHSGGEMVAGAQTDIFFDPYTPVVARTAGAGPECVVNPQIRKAGTSFSFQSSACLAESSCSSVRALVFALDNVDPIPDGSLLFTCPVLIADDAPAGAYLVTTSKRIAADPSGHRLPELGAFDGQIVVTLPPGVTPKPTRTQTQTPTSTPTHTPSPAWTPRPTVTPFTPPPTPTTGLGSPCTLGPECPTGFCVDQVCCESEVCPSGQLCGVDGVLGRCIVPPTVPPGSDSGVSIHVPHKPSASNAVDAASVSPSESGCAMTLNDSSHGCVGCSLQAAIAFTLWWRRRTASSRRLGS